MKYYMSTSKGEEYVNISSPCRLFRVHTQPKIDQVVASGVNNVVQYPMNSIVNKVVEPF